MYQLFVFKYTGLVGPRTSCCQADLVFSMSPSVGILYAQQLPAGNGATARMEISELWCVAV